MAAGGGVNEAGESSKNAAEAFILPSACVSIHLLLKPVSNVEEVDDDGELQRAICSGPFFATPFRPPVTRARSSVVAAESFGISTFPVIVPDVEDLRESDGGFADDSTLAVEFCCSLGSIDGCEPEVVNCGWEGGVVVVSIDAWGRTPFCCDMPPSSTQ